jgi:hypothetical protein
LRIFKFVLGACVSAVIGSVAVPLFGVFFLGCLAGSMTGGMTWEERQMANQEPVYRDAWRFISADTGVLLGIMALGALGGVAVFAMPKPKDEEPNAS